MPIAQIKIYNHVTSAETRELIAVEATEQGQSIAQLLAGYLNLPEIPKDHYLGFYVFTSDGHFIPENQYDTAQVSEAGLDIYIPPKDFGLTALIITIASIGYSYYTLNNLPNLGDTASDVGTKSSIYDANLQGNQVKLGGVVPVLLGTMTIYPDLIMPPIKEYKNGGEIWARYVFCLGEGQIAASSFDFKIGNTPLSNFDPADYEAFVILPGDSFPANKIPVLYNVPEVGGIGVSSGIDLSPFWHVLNDPASTNLITPFYALAPTDAVIGNSVSIDLRFPEGLCVLDTAGDVTALDKIINFSAHIRKKDTTTTQTLTFSVAAQTDSEYGVSIPLNISTVLSAFGNTNLEIQIESTTPAVRSLYTKAKCSLVGIRSHLVYHDTTGTPLNQQSVFPRVTTAVVKLKVSDVIGSASSNLKFNILAKRWMLLNSDPSVNFLDPTLGHAFRYIMTSLGLFDRVDTASLAAVETVWKTNGWEFNGLLDSASTFNEVQKKILSLGQAALNEEGGSYVVKGDFGSSAVNTFPTVQQTAPMQETFNFLPSDYDGWEIEYFDSLELVPKTLYFPDDGSVFIKPKRLKPIGLTNRNQAYQFMLRDRLSELRKKTYRVTTELAGNSLAYLDHVTAERVSGTTFPMLVTKVSPSTTGKATFDGIMYDAGTYGGDTLTTGEAPNSGGLTSPQFTTPANSTVLSGTTVYFGWNTSNSQGYTHFRAVASWSGGSSTGVITSGTGQNLTGLPNGVFGVSVQLQAGTQSGAGFEADVVDLHTFTSYSSSTVEATITAVTPVGNVTEGNNITVSYDLGTERQTGDTWTLQAIAYYNGTPQSGVFYDEPVLVSDTGQRTFATSTVAWGIDIWVTLYRNDGTNTTIEAGTLQYSLVQASAVQAVLTDPILNQALTGSSHTFRWSASTFTDVDHYTLNVMDPNAGYASLDANWNIPFGTGIATLTGLPTDGRSMYVKLTEVASNSTELRTDEFLVKANTSGYGYITDPTYNEAITYDLTSTVSTYTGLSWAGLLGGTTYRIQAYYKRQDTGGGLAPTTHTSLGLAGNKNIIAHNPPSQTGQSYHILLNYLELQRDTGGGSWSTIETVRIITIDGT